jgi:hypothetical protein
MLKKICGLMKKVVTGEWRKLPSEELHNLYSSPDIIKTIISGRIRWQVHIGLF